MNNNNPIHVLIVEDCVDDAVLLVNELCRGGFEPSWKQVDSAETLTAALETESWDIVLADYCMPHFDGLSALRILREKNAETPFIVISGQIGEETAVEVMKAGAQDYVLKSSLTRLAAAVKREISEARVNRKLEELHRRLIENASELTTILRRDTTRENMEQIIRAAEKAAILAGQLLAFL